MVLLYLILVGVIYSLTVIHLLNLLPLIGTRKAMFPVFLGQYWSVPELSTLRTNAEKDKSLVNESIVTVTELLQYLVEMCMRKRQEIVFVFAKNHGNGVLVFATDENSVKEYV